MWRQYSLHFIHACKSKISSTTDRTMFVCLLLLLLLSWNLEASMMLVSWVLFLGILIPPLSWEQIRDLGLTGEQKRKSVLEAPLGKSSAVEGGRHWFELLPCRSNLQRDEAPAARPVPASLWPLCTKDDSHWWIYSSAVGPSKKFT